MPSARAGGATQFIAGEIQSVLTPHPGPLPVKGRGRHPFTLFSAQVRVRRGVDRFCSIRNTQNAHVSSLEDRCRFPGPAWPVDYAARRGAGTIIRGGAAKGAPVRESGRGKEFPIVKARWRRSGLETLLRGLDPVETMLRYALGHVAAHTFIVGTRNLEHLKGNVRAVEKGSLEPDLQEESRRRVLAVVDDNKN